MSSALRDPVPKNCFSYICAPEMALDPFDWLSKEISSSQVCYFSSLPADGLLGQPVVGGHERLGLRLSQRPQAALSLQRPDPLRVIPFPLHHEDNH